jgi:U6 snRNA-associated Sm-like protein LSm1
MSQQNNIRPFLPGASSLIEQLDTRVLVILRDGRHILGTLRSLDQFSNLVLEDVYERHISGSKYADIYLGLYIVRGDSLVVCGEVGDHETPEGLTEVELSVIQELREQTPKSEEISWDF